MRTWTALIAITTFAATSCGYAFGYEVDPNSYAPMTQRGYPKTYAEWGEKWVSLINSMRKTAAQITSTNPSCDVVDISELSSNRSTAKKHVVIFVDCRNGQRFYYSQDELKSPRIIKPSVQQGTAEISDETLISACELAVRGALRFPSSLDKSWFTTDVYRAPTGNVVVTFDFKALNGFGAALPHRARCVTDDRGQHPPEISAR